MSPHLTVQFSNKRSGSLIRWTTRRAVVDCQSLMIMMRLQRKKNQDPKQKQQKWCRQRRRHSFAVQLAWVGQRNSTQFRSESCVWPGHSHSPDTARVVREARGKWMADGQSVTQSGWWNWPALCNAWRWPRSSRVLWGGLRLFLDRRNDH